MASIAGHLAMIVEVLLINRGHHLHHLARHLLGLFVILIEMIFNMAETALHSERSGDELHRGNELVSRDSLEHLNILESLFSGLVCGSLAGNGRGLSLRQQHADGDKSPNA
jgi:hypothetical protein